MFDKPNATSAIGLTIDGSSLKAVQLSVASGKPALSQIFELTVEISKGSAEQVNPLYMSDEGQKLVKATQKSLVVTALNSHEVMVRPLDIKLKKESDIDSVLAFQAEPILPYPIENAVLDRMMLMQTPEGTQLTLIVARKDHVQQHLEVWNGLTIEPEVITCTPASLAQFSKHFSSSTAPHFVVDLGENETTCILVKAGKLLAAQSIPIGLLSLRQALTQETALAPELDNVDFAALTPESAPQMFAAMDSWRREITRILYALPKTRKETGITEILLTGVGASCSDLGAVLCQPMGKQLLTPNADPAFSLSTAKLQYFAIPIGSALSALPHAKDQVNFRQKEFAYPHPWKRLRQPLIIYYTLSVCLALAIYFFGGVYEGYQEDQLRQEYVDLLTTMNKSYPAFEKEYTSKFPSRSIVDEGTIPPKMLTQEDIAERMQYLQKDLKDAPDLFPLQPNVPRVSDVLAWVSTHPVITGKQTSETPGNGAITIDNFSYVFVKRPESKKPQEKYQVKVEIEFSSPTPKLAREFHDALIAPNDMVDPKGEVKWSSNRGKYRASFFLKDRTSYPATVSTQH